MRKSQILWLRNKMTYHYLKLIFRLGCPNLAQVGIHIRIQLTSQSLQLTPRPAQKRYLRPTSRSSSKRIRAYGKEFWAKRVFKSQIAWWKIRTRYMNTRKWRALVKRLQLQFFKNLVNAHLSKLQKAGVIRAQVFLLSLLKAQRTISQPIKEKNSTKVSRKGIWLTNF